MVKKEIKVSLTIFNQAFKENCLLSSKNHRLCVLSRDRKEVEGYTKDWELCSIECEWMKIMYRTFSSKFKAWRDEKYPNESRKEKKEKKLSTFIHCMIPSNFCSWYLMCVMLPFIRFEGYVGKKEQVEARTAFIVFEAFASPSTLHFIWWTFISTTRKSYERTWERNNSFCCHETRITWPISRWRRNLSFFIGHGQKQKGKLAKKSFLFMIR